MKTLALLLALATTAVAQFPIVINTTTPHTNSLGNTYYGDNLLTAAGSINTNFAAIRDRMATNTFPASNIETFGLYFTNSLLGTKAILPGGVTNYLNTNLSAMWTGSGANSFLNTNRIVLCQVPSFQSFRLLNTYVATRPATMPPSSIELHISTDGSNWTHPQWMPQPVWLSLYDSQGGICGLTGYDDRVTNVIVNGFIVPQIVFRSFDLGGQSLLVDSYLTNSRGIANIGTAITVARQQVTNWASMPAISGVSFGGFPEYISPRWTLTPTNDLAGDFDALSWQYEGSDVFQLTAPYSSNSNRVQIVSMTVSGTNLTFKIFTQSTNPPSLQVRTNWNAEPVIYQTNGIGAPPATAPGGVDWIGTNIDCTGWGGLYVGKTNGADASWRNLTVTATNYAQGYWLLTAPQTDQPKAFYRASSPTNAIGSMLGGVSIKWPLTAQQGTIYPSNTWNLAAITNGMSNFSFYQGNSNGQALVTLSLSNGVVRYLQVLR